MILCFVIVVTAYLTRLPDTEVCLNNSPQYCILQPMLDNIAKLSLALPRDAELSYNITFKPTADH